ncbi:hypothetical protein WA1_48650 [Scytonema hofmannii PCC 7110]|uniref:Uncharacterized protein n=1 Tax=Scytonema hofmannii PCC 7110 TaxID=128403 RepID=A0A139WTW8_9CYAN|nr:hypothetical protein [Scytonema hofmannii]KYC35894.1 hypothetical protein WA1_48650 [Scytonema hofmannii PCC 7110]
MSMSVLKVINQPGWNYKLSSEGVSILAPTKQDATRLAQTYGDVLTETAAKIKGKVRIAWKRCKHPIEFYGWMGFQKMPVSAKTSDKPGTACAKGERIFPGETVFCSQLYLPTALLYRMIAASENQRPVSIVRQDNNQQIIVNQAMSDMLQSFPKIATQRVMTRFWLPEDLAELQRRLRNESRFIWTYCGGLNEQTWAILTTEFEAFEVEGIWYRQGTCLTTPQPVPIPPGSFQ